MQFSSIMPAGELQPRRRASYSYNFKMEVVRSVLRLPEDARIKPTCRSFPGIEPVQVRKWIRLLAPLVELEDDGSKEGRHPPPAPPAVLAATTPDSQLPLAAAAAASGATAIGIVSRQKVAFTPNSRL